MTRVEISGASANPGDVKRRQVVKISVDSWSHRRFNCRVTRGIPRRRANIPIRYSDKVRVTESLSLTFCRLSSSAEGLHDSALRLDFALEEADLTQIISKLALLTWSRL